MDSSLLGTNARTCELLFLFCHRALQTILPNKSNTTFLKHKSSPTAALHWLHLKLRREAISLERAHKALHGEHPFYSSSFSGATFLVCCPPPAPPHWSSFCSLNRPGSLSPQSLCTCRALYPRSPPLFTGEHLLFGQVPTASPWRTLSHPPYTKSTRGCFYLECLLAFSHGIHYNLQFVCL